MSRKQGDTVSEEKTARIKQDLSLDRPGAGISWYQYYFIQYVVVPNLSLVFTWDKSLLFLQGQIQEILELVQDLDEEELQQQVLVPPMLALEDSSRFWSVNMVLEHLVTVSLGTYEIVDLLSQEMPIERELGTAKVKPLHNTSYTKNLIVFEKLYTRMINKNSKQVSQTTKAHPWFGEFTNFKWHVFIGLHHKLHKRQIKKIIQGLT